MITYEEYNTKSPLNGLAAKWAAQNTKLLPIDPRSVAPPSENVSATPQAAEPVAEKTEESTPPSAPNAPVDPWNEKISIS